METVLVSLCFLLGGFSLGYVLGFHYGLSFLSSSKPTPMMPVLKAFGRREKRKPKFVSEEEQARREQRQPPEDPS